MKDSRRLQKIVEHYENLWKVVEDAMELIMNLSQRLLEGIVQPITTSYQINFLSLYSCPS